MIADAFTYDTSVTPGHTPGRYRPHGAIRTGRGTKATPEPGSAASGQRQPSLSDRVPPHGDPNCPDAISRSTP